MSAWVECIVCHEEWPGPQLHRGRNGLPAGERLQCVFPRALPGVVGDVLRVREEDAHQGEALRADVSALPGGAEGGGMIALLWLALAASLPKYASSDGDEMLAAVFAAAPVSYKPEPRWTR